MKLFKDLYPEDIVEHQTWARKHYRLFQMIDGTWHPVVQRECTLMNEEAGGGWSEIVPPYMKNRPAPEISASLGTADRPIKIYSTQMADDSRFCDLGTFETMCELTIDEAQQLADDLLWAVELSAAQLALERKEITEEEYLKKKWMRCRR
jgi:hypothetical protein